MKNQYQVVIKEVSSKPDWLNLDSHQIKQFEVIISWDSEYRNREWNIPLYTLKECEENNLESQATTQGYYNDVISHQFSAYSFSNDKFITGLIYLYSTKTKGFFKRITLAEVIS